MKIIDVFYVTCARDAEWFKQSLAVLKKNLTGYRGIHVVCEPQDRDVILAIISDSSHHNIILHTAESWNKGESYWWQQGVKMRAPQYTDADFIMHMDSDTFIKELCDVSEFFVDGKPVWLWSWYSDIGDLVPWQAPTEKALGFKCDREFMRAFPFLLHRSTYATAAGGIGMAHPRISWEEYVKGEAFLRRKFSEFNVLGSAAYSLENNQYVWLDANRDTIPAAMYKVKQFWSHAPIEDHMQEINNMLGIGDNKSSIRTTMMGHWVISNDTHISKWVEKQGRLDFDTAFMDKICEHIEPGDVVVDVGAYIGDHTWAYACATRGVDGGRVLAFEPNRIPFQCLTRNMKGHGHVECIPLGLSDHDGTMGMAQDANVGASYLVPGSDISLVALDRYDLDRCKLIKVDAEGFELSVLKGAWRTIKRCRPVLVLEINREALDRNGVDPMDIHDWLTRRGYTIKGWENESVQFDVFCYPPEQ